MTRLQADFKDFLRLLNANRVEYLLIGGYAVGYHGYPRATVDLDVWIATLTSPACVSTRRLPADSKTWMTSRISQ
jgi:hypothetical protein